MLIALNKKLASIISSCDQNKISQGYDSIQSFLWFQSVNYDVPPGSEISYLKTNLLRFDCFKSNYLCKYKDIISVKFFYDMQKRILKVLWYV